MIRLTLYNRQVPISDATLHGRSVQMQCLMLSSASLQLTRIAIDEVLARPPGPDGDSIIVSYHDEHPLYSKAHAALPIPLVDLVMCEHLGRKMLGAVIAVQADVRVQFEQRRRKHMELLGKLGRLP